MILLFFCCVGSLALPKKDTIDPWRLVMLGIGSVRPDNFCFTQTKLTSINCNDEINNHSFQTISNSYLIS
jgi:hypothetical protein